MTRKQFLVIGLGQYGLSVASALADMGCEVVAVDINEERVQNIADKVTYAVTADAADEEVMENLGVNNMDAAVIAITNNMEASILALCKIHSVLPPSVPPTSRKISGFAS